MDSIKSVIRQMAKGHDIEQFNEKIMSSLLRHGDVQAFLNSHPDITAAVVEKSIPHLFQFVQERNHCDHCPGLDKCPNILKGYQPELVYDKATINLTFHSCPLKQRNEEMKKQAELIRSYYVPDDVLQATFQSIDTGDLDRYDALVAARDFVKEYTENPKETKGLYFYGQFGVGKTYIMGAVMNALKDKNIPSLMVYTPDFFRELKGSIQERTLDEKLDYIKKVSVLILDDIGAEIISPWIRDEIIGSILQYRVMKKLPTLYTSNYNYDELEEHFSYSQKSGTELLKAKRVMERIRHYTKLVTVKGKNRRI
ncbi:primosomal protein DnaI [Scopulibacillus daqui]|uniref:Primosomal protein DnaI n=1 Tax=Scopulibacillus daqui TaxID=1469162 RepID=A0ABS2PZB1_9BACL|nr:primosomal protein DnaI [Scopulibacillus daqui]MBM7644779.1 primosomal protein DnaI [Scopulibacillus daqui]